MDVILDVDTGLDDALAIILAMRSPALNVLGLTCVMGNVEIDKVVTNTLKVLDVLDAANVPVARGVGRPMLEAQLNAKGVHGEDGLANLGLPASTRQPVPEHAVEFLRCTLTAASTPVTLIPLAPLTNIASLLVQHPEVQAKIGQIVLMGGASGKGNATAVAEFNIRQDPEAADIVLRSGLPIVMYTLDVFRQVTFTRAEAEAFIQSDRPAAQLSGRLLAFMMDNFRREEATIGDAGAVASVIEPVGLTTEQRPVRVELNGQWTRGQTVIDQRSWASINLESHWQPAMGTSIDVAMAVDRERYRQIFREAILS
jgi:pyrimidine-specific ribonucleoside hydrolase